MRRSILLATSFCLSVYALESLALAQTAAPPPAPIVPSAVPAPLPSPVPAPLPSPVPAPLPSPVPAPLSAPLPVPIFGPGAPPTAGLPYIPTSSPSGPDWRLRGGIAAAGAGVVSLVVMGVAFGQGSADQDDAGFAAYRAGLQPEQHACDVAAAGMEVTNVPGASSASAVTALCSSASAWHTAGVATAFVGGILVGGGSALILTSRTVWPKLTGKKAPFASHIEFIPVAGPTTGLMVRGAF